MDLMFTVATAIYGPGYTLHEPRDVPPHVRFVCFTDQDIDGQRWEICRMPLELSTRRANRHVKTLLHRYVSGPTLYLDAEFHLVGDPSPLMTVLGEQSWAATRHPQRDCLYDEAEFCLAKKPLEDSDVLRQQIERYESEGMPRHAGLWAGGVLARLGDVESEKLGEAWWSEIQSGSERDQISLPFVAWKQWHMPAELPWPYNRIPMIARRKRK